MVSVVSVSIVRTDPLDPPPAPAIEHGAERAEQKGQPITSFARQKGNEFRGGFERQPLQPVANLFPSRAHRSSVTMLRADCEARSASKTPVRSDCFDIRITQAVKK